MTHRLSDQDLHRLATDHRLTPLERRLAGECLALVADRRRAENEVEHVLELLERR